jgi:hypothetical protein
MRQLEVTAKITAWSLVALAAVAAAQERGRRDRGDPEATTVRTEQELKLTIEVPALPSTRCEATAATSYFQRNTQAHVDTTIASTTCPAAAGEFKIALRIRDDAGEAKTVEVDETWQRTELEDVVVSGDYPIGENVELVSARVRGLTCECAVAGSN